MTDQPTPKFRVSRRDGFILTLLCALAAARVFIFSAAFPLFNNVDEPKHCDCVWRCAHGKLISGLEKFGAPSVRLLTYYQSGEYLYDPEVCTIPFEQPTWTLAPDEARGRLDSEIPNGIKVTNIEGVQPPVYYFIAGAWYRLGLALKSSPFWIRFLNVGIIALLVWLAHVFARVLYPSRTFLHLGLPCLIAFLPQDLFYSINNGVLSPVLYGAAFCCLLLFASGRRTGLGFCAATGLLCAAAVLNQYTNLTISLPLAATVVLRLVSARRAGTVGLELRRIALLLASACAPVAAWIIRNYIVIGAPTALGQFITYTQWGIKPFSQWFHHPVFTPSGAVRFWMQLMTTFFRGEFMWHEHVLRWPLTDAFFTVSPLVFGMLALPRALSCRTKRDCAEVLADRLAWLVVAASVAALVVMSIKYEFGNWAYPSHGNPYYAYGRLMFGTALPFFALYLTGFETLMSRLGLQRGVYWLLAVMCVAMLAVDVRVSLNVFSSQFNWFHLISSTRNALP